MKVSVLNKSDKQMFIETNENVFPIGGKSKIVITLENEQEFIDLQKKYRPKLVFRKI